MPPLDSLNEIKSLLSDNRNVRFLRWLNRDKRRLHNIKKLFKVMLTHPNSSLTSTQLFEMTKVRKPTLFSLIKKMCSLGILSHRNAEKIIHINKTRFGEHAIEEKQLTNSYPYRYALINLGRLLLILSAILGMEINKNADRTF